MFDENQNSGTKAVDAEAGVKIIMEKNMSIQSKFGEGSGFEMGDTDKHAQMSHSTVLIPSFSIGSYVSE